MPSTSAEIPIITTSNDGKTIIMEPNMFGGATSQPEKEDSDTFILYDIDQDLSESDDDDESDSSDDDHSEEDSTEGDEEELQAAEAILGLRPQRRSIKKTYSFNSVCSTKSASSIGSISSLFGALPSEIEARMVKRSEKNMMENELANSASVADIQELLKQHQPNKKQNTDAVPPNIGMQRRNSSSQLAVGHIEQEASAQKVEIDDGAINPDEHFANLLGSPPARFSYDSLEGFFLPASPEMLEAWTNDLTKAVREQNLPVLEEMHQKGQLLQACNNFGESIIHLTVRRGTPEMLRFLLQDAQVSMRVCCDLGRTPLHDAAWCLASNPKSYQMMALLLNESPMQLLITDKRGHTPLSYVPRAKWAECNAFLDRQYTKGRFASLCAKK